MEDLFSTLQGDGIQRSNLYMTWDFTVASEHSLAGRALAIRDNALHQLSDDSPGNGTIDGSSPTFHISNVIDAPNAALPANTLREVDGELTNIPCYLHPNCQPGGTFNFLPNGDVDPTPNGSADDNSTTTGVRFRCLVPNSAVTGTTVNPTQSGIFGHGLLGDYTQVSDMIKFTNSEANVSNTTWCATNWAGFSSDDIQQVIATLGDVSNFSKLSDRMVQGFVNMIYLDRAMLNAGGFDTNAAFQLDPDGAGGNPPVSVLDPSQGLYWEGISQGAIMGGALTALEPDLTRSVLDVTGMNYSTLLRRSADSAQYFELPGLGLYANYTNQQERPLLLSLMQLLWDRGEANGYAEHMTSDPLPNTPAHHVLLQLAYGDHQVSNLAGETEARTIGAQVETPAARPGSPLGRGPVPRHPSDLVLPLFGLGGDGLLRRRANRVRRHPGLHRRDTATRSTGPPPRRWSSCRPTRSASMGATRIPTRGSRWTVSRRRPTGCSRAGSSTSVRPRRWGGRATRTDIRGPDPDVGRPVAAGARAFWR